MQLALYNFGWQDERKTAELEAIRQFLGEEGSPEYAEALYALLLGEVSRKDYPQDSDLSIADDQVRLSQYAAKEYYHDGSEQARKFVSIECIAQEAYLKALQTGTAAAPDGRAFKKEWLECGQDGFFEKPGFLGDETRLYIQNFFGIPYVKIAIEYAL